MNENSAVHFGKCQLDVHQDYTLWKTNNIIKMCDHDGLPIDIYQNVQLLFLTNECLIGISI